MSKRALCVSFLVFCVNVAALAWVLSSADAQQPERPERPLSQQCYPAPNPLAGMYHFHPKDIQSIAMNGAALIVHVREPNGRSGLWAYHFDNEAWGSISTAIPAPKAEKPEE